MTVGKAAKQAKARYLFGTVGGVSLSSRKNEVGIRWKANVLIRGGLTDPSNIYGFFLSERSGVKLAVRSQQMPYIATVDNVARRAEPNNQAIVIETYYEGMNAENIIPS